MTTEERLNLVKQVGEEIITEEELTKLLESEEKLIAYDGFEPSGQIHIAQGILRAINVNKMIKAGVRFRMFVADWHAMANNKMGGDLEKIKTVGRYFIEVWKASGMNLSQVEFLWASDMAKNPDYWKLVVQVGKTNALRRFVRTAEMMGREESLENLTGAHIIYSCMQVADIFMLGAKITQLGMDQRKINMLAREIGPQLGFWKPVVVSHHMLMGLQKPTIDDGGSKVDNEDRSLKIEKNQSSSIHPQHPSSTLNHPSSKLQRTIAIKMSKSHPDSAIFMTDSLADIRRKISRAWCPEGVVEENPVLEYCKYIIFESMDAMGLQNIVVERPTKFGGPVILNTYENLERLFREKKIHPMDLKQTVIVLLDRLLQPVRKHFEENSYARDLLTKVKSYQVTR